MPNDDLFTREELEAAYSISKKVIEYIELCRPDFRIDGGVAAGIDHIIRTDALPLLSMRGVRRGVITQTPEK